MFYLIIGLLIFLLFLLKGMRDYEIYAKKTGVMITVDDLFMYLKSKNSFLLACILFLPVCILIYISYFILKYIHDNAINKDGGQ